MPLDRPSNIRASALWRHSSVYAGEHIECLITFRNTAKTHGVDEEFEQHNGSPDFDQNGGRSPLLTTNVRSRGTSTIQTRPDHARALSMTSNKTNATRGHRPTLSLNVVAVGSRTTSQTDGPHSSRRSHGRSLSIISLKSDAVNDTILHSSTPTSRRGGRAHTRSTSLYHLPSPTPSQDTLSRGPSPRLPSPLAESANAGIDYTSNMAEKSMRPARQRPSLARVTHKSEGANRRARLPRGDFNSDFQFPAKAAAEDGTLAQSRTNARLVTSPRIDMAPDERWEGTLNTLNPVNRVISEASTSNDSPRTSGELFTNSNHSGETLMSDLVRTNQADSQPPTRATHSRNATQIRISDISKSTGDETLIMGSVQTLGHFTLDGSLVNAAPFDEVKRKGVQGGGVIGVERSKRNSGIFGALSWGNIGESLGGLLGTDERSSLAQMKASAGSKTIPLLSTPQTLLFVDMKLAPGESRSFWYKFPMPRGLPPSHRGRAIKIEYNLSITVQRPGGQAVQRVTVPFRMLGSYDNRGDILGHDLMSPHVLLQDMAQTASASMDEPPWNKLDSNIKPADKTATDTGLEDFLRYTERLLSQCGEQQSHALLSPTSPVRALPSPTASRQGSIAEPAPSSIKEAVDFAILRSNYSSLAGPTGQSDGRSANRYNIARSGDSIAVLTLLRPSYRLGETVVGVLDFATSDARLTSSTAVVPTYFILIELESAERVDPSLALRSSHSINRVTRKVYATMQGSAIGANRLSFNLPIPSLAAPTFETTGVSLVWRLRIAFTTRKHGSKTTTAHANENEREAEVAGLMETITRGEQGIMAMAKERLAAESFEIHVPLKVFGAVSLDGGLVEQEAVAV